ncbi:MAG: hypothetical protein PQJ60_12285 [Spirochaetales bacterium]|nr:hypothetical protein [Spirochaetales bacterium]
MNRIKINSKRGITLLLFAIIMLNTGCSVFWEVEDSEESVDGNEGEWQLAEGYYVEAKFTPEIISPQPDDTDDSTYYWRWCTSHDTYKVRVTVFGGSFPLKYELLQAPDGATMVGEFDRTEDGDMTLHEYPEDYGTITWENPTAGDHTFQVQITDQDGNSDSVTWTCTLNEDKFVWIDETNGDDSNDGSYGSPLQTFVTGLWNSDDDDDEFAGRIAKFYTGTYTVHDGTTLNNAHIDRDYKPIAYMKVEGESPVFDMTEGHFQNNGWYTCDGLTFYGCEFYGVRSDSTSPRIITPGLSDDIMIWDCTGDYTGDVTDSTDNPSLLFLSDSSTTIRERISFVDNNFGSDFEVEGIVTFASDYVVVENNSWTDTPTAPNGDDCFNMKDDTRYASVRFNRITGDMTDPPFLFANQGSTADSQESCYNRIYATYTGSTPNASAMVQWNGQDGSTDTHDYRNTVCDLNAEGIFGYRFYQSEFGDSTEGDSVEYQANIVVTGQDYAVHQSGLVYTESEPYSIELETTDLDANGELTGTARTSYLGMYGAELASPIE